MKETRKIILKYSITLTVSGLVTLLVLYLHGYFEATELVDKYRILADGFTIPGVILVMLTALVWISSKGFFDSLAYAFMSIKNIFIPTYYKSYKHETYYEYKESRKEKRASGYSFLFYCGAVFMIVAFIFVGLHSSVYVA